MKRSVVRLARLKARRRVWLQVHLWLGLVLGAWIAIIGVTGSILVYHRAIDTWLNPTLFQVTPQAGGESAFQPLDAALTAAQAILPAEATSGFAVYPEDNARSWQFVFNVPDTGGDGDEVHVFVDPYTLRVIGSRLVRPAGSAFPRAFIPFVFSLHYEALAGWEVGGTLVGVVCVLGLISVMTGVILWWPLTGHWRAALTLKRGTGAKRFNYDLHRLTGLYTLAVMLALLVSGVYMNLPEQFYWLVNRFSPAVDRFTLRSTAAPGARSITPTEAMTIAAEHTPAGRFDWIHLPTKPTSVYTFCKGGLGEVSRFVDRRCIVIDQYSGAVSFVEDVASGHGGQTFAAWQWSLHSGQAFGTVGRILVLLTGLACAVLFITGTIRWLQKRAAQRVEHARRAIAQPRTAIE